MILLRLIGLFFVVMAFFSIGAVAGIRMKSKTSGRAPSPGFLDLAIIFLSWVAALTANASGYRSVVASVVGAGIGFFAAFTLHRVMKQTPDGRFWASNLGGKDPATGTDISTPNTPQSDHDSWTSWRTFARQVGRFQSGLLLSAFYFTVFAPFGILVGNLGDPLGIKVPPGESFWRHREDDCQNLEEARRQS